MKISQKTITLIAVITIIVIFIFKLFPFKYSPPADYIKGTFTYKENKLDSLNHALHAAQANADQVKYARRNYISGPDSYSGFSTFIGVGTLSDFNGDNKQAWIRLNNIGLKLYERVGESYLGFYTVKGRGYLTKLKFEKGVNGTKVSSVDQKVAYRYDLSANCILLPCYSKFLEIVMYVLIIAIFLFLFITFLFALTTFFKFLLAISRNEAFTISNTRRLKEISIAMFIQAFAPLVLNLITYLIFIAFFSSDGIDFTYSFWKLDVYFLIVAILSYVMYTAFKHAMLLSEESQLTI